MFHSLFTTQASRAWPALGLLMMVTGYVRGQVAPPSNLSVDLAAFDSRSAQAPANTNAFLIPITVDPPTAGGGDALIKPARKRPH